MPLSAEEDVNRGGRGGEGAPSRAGPTTTPGERALALLKLADIARGARRRALATSRPPNAGKPRNAFLEDEMPVVVDNLRFFAGAGAHPRGPGVGRVHRGLHLDHPARAGRRRRPDRAVELPADDGGLEDRPGARGRQHDRAEAGRDDADHDGEARRARGRGAAEGRAQRDHRPRRAGRARRS